MKLYGPPVTANYHRVAVILNEVGLGEGCERVSVDLLKGEQKEIWFLAINPFGKIPVLQDDDVTLRESRAICRYLLEQYAPEKAAELLGRTPLERALVSQWEDTDAILFHPAASAIAQERLLKKLKGAPPDEARVQENQQKVSELLDNYEAHLKNNDSGGYLAAGRLTFADLTHAPCLLMLEGSGCSEMIASRPHVAKWWGRISAHPAWAKVAEGPSLAKLAAAKGKQ